MFILDGVTHYRTIVADPPWRYQKQNEIGIRTAEANYETMTTDQIATLPIRDLAADNAHLYMWVTNALLLGQRPTIMGETNPPAIVRAWGFEPKALITWRKTKVGMGWFYRGRTEHVIFGVRGNLPVPAEHREPNIFDGPSGTHSEKPDCFYDMVERVSPGPYAELFARRARFGWDYPIGDQALGGVAA